MSLSGGDAGRARRPGAPPMGSPLRRLRRLVALHVWSGLVAWRWLLLVPAFGLGGVAVADILRAGSEGRGAPWQGDMWDLFPALLSHHLLLHFLVGFGFLLLVGDTHLREVDGGTAALAVMRSRSRALSWVGEMGAVGVMASAFAGIGLLIVWLVGLFVAPPSSAWPMLPREAAGFYPAVSMPLPVYNLLLAGYTAWALWVLGCGAVLASLFVRHRVGMLVALGAWALAGADPGAAGSGPGRLLEMGYFIGPHKHRGAGALPLGVFFALTAGMLVLIGLAGAWKLRREEL